MGTKRERERRVEGLMRNKRGEEIKVIIISSGENRNECETVQIERWYW